MSFDGRYEEISLSPGAGHKVDIYFKGERRLVLSEERTRAEQEKARADLLAARLRELGVDPDVER